MLYVNAISSNDKKIYNFFHEQFVYSQKAFIFATQNTNIVLKNSSVAQLVRAPDC